MNSGAPGHFEGEGDGVMLLHLPALVVKGTKMNFARHVIMSFTACSVAAV